jgi:hypothetical protein
MPNNEGKLLLYQTDDGKATVGVRFEDEIFWATQKAMDELFDEVEDIGNGRRRASGFAD